MRVEDMAWPEVGRLLTTGALAVLPVAAAAKEHGPHLPMATDRLQADWLCARLAERRPLLVWPVLTYGFYPAFNAYPGSASLTRGTFRAVVAELARGILEGGARGLVVLDTGISTLAPAREAVGDLAMALHVGIHDGPRYRAAAVANAGPREGGHADELETARLLAIAPEHVDMALARRAVTPERLAPGPLQKDDPAAANHSPSGATGSPALATAVLGRQLLAAMLADLEEAIGLRFGA